MAIKKEQRLLGVGILGCGPISQFGHLESVQKARNTQLRAVCDADEGLANRFGAFYDASAKWAICCGLIRASSRRKTF